MGAMVMTTPGAARALEHRIVRPDGSEVWAEATATYEDDGPGVLQILLVDVSLRRSQQAALRSSRDETRQLAEEFQLLAEEIPSGAFRADADGRILFANARFWSLAGTREVTALHELAAPFDAGIVTGALDAVARRGDDDGAAASAGPAGDGETTQIEFRSRDDGRTLSLRLGAVRANGPHRGTVVGVLIDATSTVELRTRARTDPLTGLLNRSALSEHLDDVLADGRDLSVLFIDVDDFKRVNDRHGHHAGDEVLRVLARRLRGAVRGSEEVGRYGGDEFVVACTSVDPTTVENLRHRVEAVLSEPVHFDDTLWSPSASIGMASARPGDTSAALLRRADAEMYRIKRERGRRGAPTGEAAEAG
jgi:diguanylate cyclase (GGDEF)-like protein